MSTKRVARCCALAALEAAVALPAPARDAPGTTQALDPIVVIAPVPALDRSMHLVRLLVARSAPCLVPAVPPLPSETEQLLFDIKAADSPELDFLRP